jgi:hypothetical protein
MNKRKFFKLLTLGGIGSLIPFNWKFIKSPGPKIGFLGFKTNLVKLKNNVIVIPRGVYMYKGYFPEGTCCLDWMVFNGREELYVRSCNDIEGWYERYVRNEDNNGIELPPKIERIYNPNIRLVYKGSNEKYKIFV